MIPVGSIRSVDILYILLTQRKDESYFDLQFETPSKYATKKEEEGFCCPN